MYICMFHVYCQEQEARSSAERGKLVVPFSPSLRTRNEKLASENEGEEGKEEEERE